MLNEIFSNIFSPQLRNFPSKNNNCKKQKIKKQNKSRTCEQFNRPSNLHQYIGENENRFTANFIRYNAGYHWSNKMREFRVQSQLGAFSRCDFYGTVGTLQFNQRW